MFASVVTVTAIVDLIYDGVVPGRVVDNSDAVDTVEFVSVDAESVEADAVGLVGEVAVE